MSPYEALNIMREQTTIGVPFSMSYQSYNSSKNIIDGVKEVKRAILRQGLRNDTSEYANELIAYTNIDTDEPRFFRVALLLSFNNEQIEV
jgi:hypothetical protein